MVTYPQIMSSSFDKESSGISYGTPKMRPPLLADSHSQPSVTELSLVNTGSRETRSFDDISRNNSRVHYPGGVAGVGSIQGSSRTITAGHRRDSSSSSDESDDWDEKLRRDPVGDLITDMLNEGKVPHFGYSRITFAPIPPQEEDRFKLSPLFSARNCRALRKFLFHVWNDHGHTQLEPSGGQETAARNTSHSMRFLLESFAALYIAIYSVNDIALRWLSEFILCTLLGTICTALVDVEEVKQASSFLFTSMVPSFCIVLFEKINDVAREIYLTVEGELLWGHLFLGRTFLWSDSDRLVKFRRKHRRLMATNNERKKIRKQRRKTRNEIRRREKRGESFTAYEFEKMEEEIAVKEKLESATLQLTLSPPTFFHDTVDYDHPDTALRKHATKQHMESLYYCHKMVFLGRQERDVKPVSIRTSNDKRDNRISQNSALSPKEAVEVIDQFPDIGSDINLDRHGTDETSVSTTFSDAYSTNYDHCSDYSSGDDSDEVSLGSYESESTTRSMPWVVVGAKIGHKLLNARKLRRVIANPDAAQKLIPEEAKKLIDGINKDISPPKNTPSPTTAQSWDGPVVSESISEEVPGLLQSKSTEVREIKRPVHGMWTSAGAAANASNTYGAVTLAASAASPKGQSFSIENDFSRVESPTSPLNNKFSTPVTYKRLNGLKKPPTSPEIELQVNKTGDMLGYETPSPMIVMPTSPPRTREVATPGTPTNSVSHQLFSETPPPPIPPVTRLAPIEKGVKMVVPLLPPNSKTNAASTSGSCFYQMGTVMTSRRIYVGSDGAQPRPRKRHTNCLAINVILDKALLRGGKFVEMNLRIMDEWNYVPRHSKFPIGSCVATTFGVGVLVGWRVEDDMHIIRSLWKRNGPGSGLAYLRRDSVHSVVEAAVGFDVQTTYGAGKVEAYVRGGKKNTSGKYFVRLNGRHKGRVMEFNRCQILSCQGATFVPVTEHIRAAALYRLEVLHYKAKLREQMLNKPSRGVREKGMWRNFSEYVDLFANSFSKAIAEDPDFDSEFDKFVSHIINLLDGKKENDVDTLSFDSEQANEKMGICESARCDTNKNDARIEATTAGWNISEFFGCFFVDSSKDGTSSSNNQNVLLQAQAFEEAHKSAGIFIRVLLRTITVARASVPDRPKLHIALAMIHEALLLIRQILRVQQKNTSKKLIEAWFRALHEISNTFGPLKERTAALGVQIAKKFRKHGSIAKRRILRFVDIVLGDTRLLHALELGDWRQALSRFEVAIVKASITDADTCEQLHKGVAMMYKNLAPRKKDRKSKAAAARNGQKMVQFAKFMKIIASPGRSILRLLTFDEVLAIFDRVLVRVFEKDPLCSMVINIYAFNFESIRHLRTLNNMSIAGKLWETVLDAIDEELTFATSEIPEQTKYFLDPFIKLFSLGVSQFHCIQKGSTNADWLDFLMEDEAVKIIQELDYKLIDSLEALCNDIKQVVQVLPYIKTIDNDILNLMDEFDFDIFLKEITDVIGDSEKSMAYITERSAILVERFLDYLPRMSIPIERRELQDGWVLTCRSKDGGDLCLSDLSVLRENLLLSVLGSENVFHPLSGEDNYIGSPRNISPESNSFDFGDDGEEEESVLDEIRELIESAQTHGAWNAGVGGLKEPYKYNGVPCQLTGLPLSDKLKTQIDKWQTSAVSDFDLLETAIREVSHQIQLQKEREEKGIDITQKTKRFNPRLDPTILFLDIKNLTLRLEEFGFRVEKGKPMTIFDPVFEGCGSITVKNVSITLKVEVKKERVFRGGLETPRPVLQLAKFDVGLEKLKLEFMETGADWILNAVLKGFGNQITEIVQENLKEQIVKQVHILLEQVNGFIDANPDLLLNALDITMKDIEESIVCV